MNRKQRVIFSDNGVLIDISANVNSFREGSKILPIVAAQDAIYVGAELPFNHKYFELSVVNDVASVISVEIWNGVDWITGVDVIDETSVGGKTFAKSGAVSFASDIDTSSWNCHRDSNDITGLTGTRIFNLFWARFKFSGNLKSTTELNYVGQCFSSDNDLKTFYPDLINADLMDSFQTGKTDWKEQHFAAAEAIVMDLRRQGILVRREQILDSSLYNTASVHKCAAIIYAGLNNQAEQMKSAVGLYTDTLNIKYHEIDRNGDGQLDTYEQTFTTKFGTR